MKAETRPGARVRVYSNNAKDLGFGTYLRKQMIPIQKGEYFTSPWIFMDSGFGIFGFECSWSEAEKAPPFSPIKIILPCDVRTFCVSGVSQLVRTGQVLPEGQEIILEQLQSKAYDHRRQVAAKFSQGSEEFWILVTEMEPISYTEAGEAATSQLSSFQN